MSSVFVDTFFPNGSPLRWREAEDGVVEVYPIPDHARFSPNRQFTHWHMRLVLPEGDLRETVKLRFATVMNCWNGKESPAMREEPACGVVSADGEAWRGIYGQQSELDGFAVEFDLPVSPIIHFASLVPYTEDDLERLLVRLDSVTEARTYVMGRTVEGLPLHMIEIGSPNAPESVFLRARAHPWETGGSWLIEGLIEQLTNGSETSREILERVRFCIQPMANRDGVRRGMTRFTVTGIDLNRHWHPDVPHDPVLAPENGTLANWFEEQAGRGQLPRLAIDLHNDCNGRLHLSHPTSGAAEHAERMAIFENLLREYTWFREGHTGHGFCNSGTFGEGLTETYGIDAIIWELRANYAEGLGRQPLAEDWRTIGARFVRVMSEFLAATR